MRNITVTIPDDAYRRARVWAAQRDTSLSAVVKHLLETLLSEAEGSASVFPRIQRAASAFPDRKSNPTNTIHTDNSPSQKKLSVFASETVEAILTNLKSNTCATILHGNTHTQIQ